MGQLHILHGFSSPQEGTRRTLRVYLPDAYEASGHRRLAVVYFQDGQNVFRHPESARRELWWANEAIERVAAEGRCEPAILVGVDHGPDRFADYSPRDEPRLGVSAKGPLYVSFLADTLKPFIDRTFRTRPEREHTAVVGSSLGGLVSLYAGWSRPEVFGRLGGMSPTVMWSGGRLFDLWREKARLSQRIWLDVGTEERFPMGEAVLDYPAAVPAFHRHLKALGYGDEELRLVVARGAGHDEVEWRRRLPDALAFLLG